MMERQAMGKWIAGFGLFLLICCCTAARAAAPASEAPSQPPSQATASAADQILSSASGVEQILDALHKRGQGLKDFVADVTMAEVDALGGDTVKLFGRVWFQDRGDASARIRVSFDRRETGKKVDTKAKVDYLLDNGMLIERDHRQKLEIQRTGIIRPGQKVNLLKLGEGPFPLPVGQPREEVIKLFEVNKVDPKADDPANAVHIQLVPRKGTTFERKFHRIDVWVDARGHFPSRIETEDRNQTEIRITDLANLRINEGIGDQAFALEKVEGFTVKQDQMPD